MRPEELLPAPRPDAVTRSIRLDIDAPAWEVAEAFRDRPGFIWLDHAGEGDRLFFDPLAVLSGGFDLLKSALEAWRGPSGAFLCGYLGYELAADLENIAFPTREPADLPDLYLGLYDQVLERDCTGWTLHTTNAWRSHPTEPRPEGSGPANPANPPLDAGPLHSNDDAFRSSVARLVECIHAGEVFEVNLCRRLETTLDSHSLWPLYLRLRRESPASLGAFIHLGEGRAVLSVSPELFLRLEGGRVTSCPIKGTRPRGTTPEEDRALRENLLASEKDRAELAMIVDVTRNDLGRVSIPGSVQVLRHAEPMALPTVHHTYSEVSGVLRQGLGPAQLLRASFPPASISGAPKIHAIELAAQEEVRRRGPAMGAIGWISLDGNMELSVAIRTAAASAGRIWYLAGCGITADSQPDEELAESEAKAAAFRRALT